MNSTSTVPYKPEKKKLSFVETLFKPMSTSRPFVPLEIQKANLLVKTADSKEERALAYQLRYEIFYKEFGGRCSNIIGVDKDRFDKNADLLIIKDLKTQKVIGTYRVICSKFSNRFYSSTEFDLKKFLSIEDVKVELSRACIDPAYRSGFAIKLLWKAIYQYMNIVNGRYLFGCSSVTSIENKKILSIMSYLQKEKLSLEEWNISPLSSLDNSSKLLKSLHEKTEENPIAEIPALFRAYLNAGAKFEVIPAYDAFFSCYDFFTLLDMTKMKNIHLRHLKKA